MDCVLHIVVFDCNHARTDAGVTPGVYTVLRQVSSNDVRLLFIVRVAVLYFLVITVMLHGSMCVCVLELNLCKVYSFLLQEFAHFHLP